MATVVGKTSVRIDELLSPSIVLVEIQDGQLFIETRGGARTLVGSVGEGSGTNSASVHINFATPSSTWICEHNLNSPSVHVTCYNSDNEEIQGDVILANNHRCYVTFYYPTTGRCIITK